MSVSLHILLNQRSGHCPKFIRVFKQITVSSNGKAMPLKPCNEACTIIHIEYNQRIPIRNAHICRCAKLYSRERLPQDVYLFRICCSELRNRKTISSGIKIISKATAFLITQFFQMFSISFCGFLQDLLILAVLCFYRNGIIAQILQCIESIQ